MSVGPALREASDHDARLAPLLSRGGQSGSHLPEARRDFLSALARHQDIKRELVPLLAAWRAAGIDALLYKGFFLAEFVYPAPGSRFHGDVDLLIRPERRDEARRIAEGMGWKQRWAPARFGEDNTAVAFVLYRPSGSTQLDVHQLLAPARAGWDARQRQITDAVWAAASVHPWEGTSVLLPAPADAIIVALALERALADDAHGFKPHDPVDLFHLMKLRGAAGADLDRRARELGLRRTLARFLGRCQPSPQPLALRVPFAARLAWRTAAAWEAGFVRAPRPLLKALRAPGLVVDVLRVLPVLRLVRRALGEHRDLHAVLARVTPAGARPAPGSPALRWRVVRGIHWAARLFPAREAGGFCVQRSLAIYAALRGGGWDVSFVSGVARGQAAPAGHAWVEEDGELIPELASRETVAAYRPNFRYP